MRGVFQVSPSILQFNFPSHKAKSNVNTNFGPEQLHLFSTQLTQLHSEQLHLFLYSVHGIVRIENVRMVEWYFRIISLYSELFGLLEKTTQHY